MSPSDARVAAPDRLDVNLRTLLRLRWATVTVEALLVLAGAAAGWPVAVGPILAVLAVLGLSNLVLGRFAGRRRASSDRLAGAVLLIDSLALTGILALGGGVSNPFTALYFLQVVAAALLSTGRWTAVVLLACAGGYASLFLLPADPHAAHLAGHLSGMWGAFVVLGSFFGWAITRLRRELAAAEASQRQARALQARTERLASLATLATGAAHELATPLGTIAVAAHEMQRGLAEGPQALREDAALIAAQIDRCRAVLEDLAADAGSAGGEAFVPCSPAQLVQEVLAHLGSSLRERVEVRCSGDSAAISLPARLLGRALRGLVKNGLDASGPGGRVRLLVSREPDRLLIHVQDEGEGLRPEVLRRAGEPFFTTKPPGQGTGLGLFFARSVVRSLGGELRLRSLEPGACADVTLPIPLRPAVP